MKRIVFFDGVCKLCHGVVDWFLPLFTAGEIYFAPLQGPTARQTLSHQDLSLDGVIYLRDGVVHKKSQAIIWIIRDSRSILHKPIIMFQLIPTPLLDIVYDLIARMRYRLFGKTNSCRIPTPKERQYFLD